MKSVTVFRKRVATFLEGSFKIVWNFEFTSNRLIDNTENLIDANHSVLALHFHTSDYILTNLWLYFFSTRKSIHYSSTPRKYLRKISLRKWMPISENIKTIGHQLNTKSKYFRAQKKNMQMCLKNTFAL